MNALSHPYENVSMMSPGNVANGAGTFITQELAMVAQKGKCNPTLYRKAPATIIEFGQIR